jgi:hypothetical protein
MKKIYKPIVKKPIIIVADKLFGKSPWVYRPKTETVYICLVKNRLNEIYAGLGCVISVCFGIYGGQYYLFEPVLSLIYLREERCNRYGLGQASEVWHNTV